MFGVRPVEYVALAKLQNSIEDEFGIKVLSLKPLGHHRKGLVLQMAGKFAEYELLWEHGGLKLGVFANGKRWLAYQGSPSVENEWLRLLQTIRQLELVVKAGSQRVSQQVMRQLTKEVSDEGEN
jgi:hypothetical protein